MAPPISRTLDLGISIVMRGTLPEARGLRKPLGRAHGPRALARFGVRLSASPAPRKSGKRKGETTASWELRGFPTDCERATDFPRGQPPACLPRRSAHASE